uniref:Putative secreted protein n=1 Tax=Anopheles darlingi TaxID=43151 RepID=A0A2M4D6V9_ANODA
MLRLLSTSSASLITFSPLLFKASSSALMVAASLKLASALASSSSKPASVFVNTVASAMRDFIPRYGDEEVMIEVGDLSSLSLNGLVAPLGIFLSDSVVSLSAVSLSSMCNLLSGFGSSANMQWQKWRTRMANRSVS